MKTQLDFLFTDHQSNTKKLCKACHNIESFSRQGDKYPKLDQNTPNLQKQHLIVVFCFETVTVIARISVPNFWKKC